ncbi:hypothetical protein GOA77_16440 [Sinorhizobium meliloti]|uniref:hypothetical protein n=1 Tax=Rhizobium meliloti TaxID=382 RepID=UPI00030C3FE5|nr:hypothetical protein [Sinorhizobium meliloti]AIM03711.1 hypothetical protein DU99_31600 [Sinorhizobium meliloti]ASQ14811.1 hypothetical protein CDO22_33710 [Sinorhizobium meliloti]MDE4552956.1 hypothetical protein [Sinorhizobium meliloti]MDW9441632.1 hypothetical protein [Sinorhizobium meliloti]MDW9516140.1 hypothetical protein [Sinorhizobium meliloti]
MSSRPPPIPPNNRSDKGTGEPGTVSAEPKKPDVAENPEKKGQQGNTKVNTTHQGYQQDR